MDRFKLTIIIGIFGLLLGCASSHNLEDDDFNSLGGGYSVDVVDERLYFIEAKTNFAPWKNFSAARKMWNKHATEACGSDTFTELAIEEHSYNTVPGVIVRYIVSVKAGYALCADTAMSISDAEELAREHSVKLTDEDNNIADTD